MLVLLYYISSKKFKDNSFNLNFHKLQSVCNIIYNLFFNYCSTIMFKSNSSYLVLKNNSKIMPIFIFLKNLFSLNFSQLLDIIIVDRLEMKLYENKRFHYIYMLLSTSYNFRIFVCGFLYLFEILPSLMNLYKSAD